MGECARGRGRIGKGQHPLGGHARRHGLVVFDRTIQDPETQSVRSGNVGKGMKALGVSGAHQQSGPHDRSRPAEAKGRGALRGDEHAADNCVDTATRELVKQTAELRIEPLHARMAQLTHHLAENLGGLATDRTVRLKKCERCLDRIADPQGLAPLEAGGERLVVGPGDLACYQDRGGDHDQGGNEISVSKHQDLRTSRERLRVTHNMRRALRDEGSSEERLEAIRPADARLCQKGPQTVRSI